MVVARASGTDLASSLKRNTFLTLALCPAGCPPCLGNTRGEVSYPYLGSLSHNLFCFKLDAKSVPEALATTILILLMFSIVLAHRPGTVARACQLARECLLTTPGHPPDVVT